jgi:GNAT superfamily N-acetyltransferase
VSVSALQPDVASVVPRQGWAGSEPPLSERGLQLRLLEPQDRQQLVALFDLLSPQSRYQRYFSPLPSLPDGLVGRLAGIDHRRHEAIGVFDDAGVLIGTAHYVVGEGRPAAAEVSVEVADHRQRQGIGALLLRALARLAIARGIARFHAVALRDNASVRRLIDRLGWTVTACGEGSQVTYTWELVQA